MERPEQKEEPPEPTVLCCFPGYNDVAGREDARFGKRSPDNDAAHRRHPRPCCDARLVSVVIDSHRAGCALGIGCQPIIQTRAVFVTHPYLEETHEAQ